MPARDDRAPCFEAERLTVAGIGPLDLTLARGDCLALSGPSGAGKTRLLRAMADLEAHGGRCRLDGRAASEMPAPAWRKAVAFLAAETAWWADTARAHLGDTSVQADAFLAALGLDAHTFDAPIERLSSGQRQRLALVRLLAGGPRVLLLDEPTANLDADNIARVERLITGYCRDRGACCVWVSHDAAQRARVARHQIAIDGDGRAQPCS